ncbi:MAG: hypothetical protein GX621_17905 [Pirellulaceae bacterium]|nr:hypothetical protein [Pirellulaceae bacterium]
MNRFWNLAKPRSGCFLLLVAAVAAASGCGENRRQGIEGTVTFDGRPIPNGNISFIPQGDARGPAAGAVIKDGRFAIDPAKGTFAGTFRVEIVAARETAEAVVDPVTGERVSLREQYIPAKYNVESELTADIKEGEPNRLEYDLTSK